MYEKQILVINVLAFNGDIFLFFHFFLGIFLREAQLQDTVLIPGMYILLADGASNKEASGAMSVEALSADISAFILL